MLHEIFASSLVKKTHMTVHDLFNDGSHGLDS